MRLSTWVTIAKRSSVWAALLSWPLAAAYAQEPAPAAPAKAEAHKPAAAISGAAPAATGADKGASKPPKAKLAGKAPKAAKSKATQPEAAAPAPVPPPAPAQLAQVQPPLRLKSSEPLPPSAAGSQPVCSLAEPEQPRGGRLEVLGDRFGSAPVVRIAGKPARMLERRADRISVQIPADSDGGAITLQNDGKALACGNLVIIGKNR